MNGELSFLYWIVEKLDKYKIIQSETIDFSKGKLELNGQLNLGF